ncbi:non-canonical purine NTP pyrophosphatase [Patescibacteria group bacterium]|nr:non-canonical purine NTP pyrophosphatase [Patescibacteria group bacterium]
MNNKHRLLIATTNLGKFGEIEEVLGDLNLDLFHLKNPDISSLILDDNFEETGETFEENSKLKAMHYGNLTGFPTIGEDSGIIVDALKGELGVKTRRWGAGPNASDKEWIEYFMNVMENVPEKNRTARFICCASFLHNDKISTFRGETEGIITHQLQAPIKPGIPLSSCFIPISKTKVYAALNEKEKNQISHRGKAFHEMKDFIAKAFDKS